MECKKNDMEMEITVVTKLVATLRYVGAAE